MRKATLTLLGSLTLFLAAVLSGCGGGSSPAISVSLATSPSPTIDQGQVVTVTATIVNDSANKGVTWSLSGVGTLSNQTTTAVTYVAPASVTTATKVTVTATSASDANATASIAIEVNPPPSITSTSMPSGTAGTCYGQVSNASGVTCNGEALAETGGTTPFVWSVIAGGLPPGLSLNASSGIITGTPTTPGPYTAKYQLTDAVGQSATATLSITIANPPALTVTTTALPTAAINVSYSATLKASGGVAPYNWSLSSGTLPAGLSLSPSGIISGIPSGSPATSSFTVQVTDSEGPSPVNATQALSITVNTKPFSITTTSLPSGTVGISYGTTLQYSGGTPSVTWSIVGSGTLPSGLTLTPSTGIISGTPTGPGGTSSFTVEATDSQSPTPDTATQALSISISSTTKDGFLNGHYAFSLGGYAGGMVGSFDADGIGGISTGTVDIVNKPAAFIGVSAGNFPITGGTYTIGADNRGILSLDADAHTFTFDLALSSIGSAPSGASSQGAMIETDTSGNNFTGSFALQNSGDFSSTVLAGGYAFGFSGWDSTTNPDVVVGSASISGGAVSSGLLDENDAGNLSSAVTFTGSLSVDSNSGRGTITSSTSQASFVFYVVSTSEWYAIAYDPTTGAVRTGLVEQQSGGPYSDTSIQGNMVLESQSSTSAPAPQAEVGLFTSTGTGSANTSLDVDAGGTLSTPTDTDALSFTSSANGRFTGTPQNSAAFVGYMIAPNQAFIAGTGSTPSFGTIVPQSAGPFTASSLNGTFFLGSLPLVSPPPNSQPPTVSSGVIAFDGTVNYTGTIDSSTAGKTTTTQLTNTYSVDSTGRVSVTQGGAIMYIVSPSQVVILSTGQAGSTNPLIEIAQR